MRIEEGWTGLSVGLSPQAASPVPHKRWLERRDGPRCEKQEAGKERIGRLRVCGVFLTQKPKISKNKPGKRRENADFSQSLALEPQGNSGWSFQSCSLG